MRRRSILLAAGLALAAGQVAFAADFAAPPPATDLLFAPNFIAEARLGASAQDVFSPEAGSANLTGEILFAKPFRADDAIVDLFIPRLHVGGSLNFAGKTSFVYAGLTWSYDFTERIFVEGQFGGALHNGDTHAFARPGHNALGCAPAFHEAASLGYRISARWSVLATIEHMSNAGFCDQNRGLTNVGARLSYRF